MKLLALLCLPLLLKADGGVVQLRKEAGPFVVTVFASPAPLRVGQLDLSVLVQGLADRAPILDAEVLLRMKRANGVNVTAHLTHNQATNKLLYAADVNLPGAGEWDLAVEVRERRGFAVASGTVVVVDAQPSWTSYWPYFALPAVLVILFAVHQSLRRKAARARAT